MRSSLPLRLRVIGGGVPGRRLSSALHGVEPPQELGDRADLGDTLVERGLLVTADKRPDTRRHLTAA